MKQLNNWPTSPPKDWDKSEIKDKLKSIKKEIEEEVIKLRADGNKAILLVLQGMDASGKDGLTRAVFEGLSPDWVDVTSFKKPSPEEALHDYLWRIHKAIPAKGMIGVFNRSHYEDILVPSVYGTFPQETIEQRFAQINQFETYLTANNIVVIKCFLNISKERQEEKLIERIQVLEKHYKHSDGDWETREHWDAFMKAYDQIITRCNTPEWNIIPCDSSTYRNYIAAEIILKELKALNLKYPALESERFNTNSFK